MPVYTDILILASLRQRAQHGYEIKKSLERRLGGFFTLTNSALYPALQRFEEMGAIRREVVQQEGKPDRHIYHLTSRGGEVMLDLLRDFSSEKAKRNAEFLVRVAFLDMLDPSERIAILKARQQSLQIRKANLPRLGKSVPRTPEPSFLGELLLFREQQFQLELDWIERLIQQQERLL
jgi:DNA-binding PadR family transcriptional regulator